MAAQDDLRRHIERDPVHFFNEELDRGLEASRDAIRSLVGAYGDDLVFVRNATAGVAAVLASIRLAPGDEILRTSHGYNACNNILDRAAEQSGARVVVASVPFPVASAEAVIEAVLRAVSERTRLAVIDHITSPTGMLLPIAALVQQLQARGVDVLVDGAHGPGMVPIDLNQLGAAYYTGNLHKWCCSARGAAFLHVRRDRQAGLHPAVTSHGKNVPRSDRSRFLLEFDWQGSDDYTAMLTVPVALRFMAGLRPGGLSQLMTENHRKVLDARRRLADVLNTALPCPDDLIGALAALPLPSRSATDPRPNRPVPPHIDPLQAVLYERHRIQVPVMPWPTAPQRLIRVSAQHYNDAADYESLANALRAELSQVGR